MFLLNEQSILALGFYAAYRSSKYALTGMKLSGWYLIG